MTHAEPDPDALSLWIHASCNPALRCGGWAWVRAAGGAPAGAAGGARGVTDPVPMALAALAAALADLPKGSAAPLVIHAQSNTVAQALRAGLTQLARPARVVAAAPEPRTPAAFAAAWAELARDKAKASGDFVNAIPKANLAKALG